VVTYLPKPSRLAADDRRKQLIDVAIDLFSRKGFGGTTTKEIAAAAGVNEAIIFRHFATKQKLYEAILEHRTGKKQVEEGFAELQALMKKRDDQAVVAWIVGATLCIFREDPRFERLMLFAALEGHEIAVMHHNQVITPFLEALRAYIESRQAEGALIEGAPELLIWAMGGMPAHYAMVRYLFNGRAVALLDDEVDTTFTRILMSGLGTGKKGKKK
jgi:TetR/AcrR family transcriptional regulator